MGENSKIEWCDHTFNPWMGCTKVSAGCANCYAEELMDHRYGKVTWGKGKQRVKTSPANWRLPVRWNREAHLMIECEGCRHRYILKEGKEESFCPECDHPAGHTVRPRVFCASLADWLDDEVPIDWLADLLKLIHETPNLDWLLLTKRPENWRKRLWALHEWIYDVNPLMEADYRETRWRAGDWTQHGTYPENVWLGTSVENQEAADKRIPELITIPTKVRFLSCEPLLGAVDIEEYLEDQLDGGYVLGSNPVHWVICGGESGPRKRLMNLEWARSLRDQCKAEGVPFFMKQIDKVQPVPEWLMIREFPGTVVQS